MSKITKKVILEIDGVRHRLVSSKLGGDLCEKCSIKDYCGDTLGNPCMGMNSYFRKESKTK